jgi:Leucine-rich repeat (LRR) protein
LQLSNPQKEPFVYSPAQLANFTTLESIYLSNNIIIGDLSTLASLVNIQNLDLSCYDIIEDCAVTGTLNFLQYTPNIISLYLGSLNLE